MTREQTPAQRFRLMITSFLWATWLLGATEASAGSDWKLIWQDEFDGSRIDETKWDYDIGNGFYAYDVNTWIPGWGNEELQYYTKDPANVFVKNGRLHIRALKRSRDGFGYTSGRLKSSRADHDPLFNMRYGRIETRAKFPVGQGLWSAIWMLPQKNVYGPWAASGEIDIVEIVGQHPDRVLGSLHFGGRWPTHAHHTETYHFPDGQDATTFHVYALEWEPGEIRWFVNDALYATQTFWWSSSKTKDHQGILPTDESDLNPWPAPFDQPFYLIINLAVGGRLPAPPDDTTPFPAHLEVDYIRVYEKEGGYTPTPARGPGSIPFQPPAAP